MKIGELAKLTDCSIQAIRYYEKEGLIASSARSGGNFRLYNQAAVQRLLFIKHCRSLNLPLCDIRQILQLQDTPSAQCDQVNQMIGRHLEEVKRRIAELESLRLQLQALQHACTEDRTVDQCGILQNLSNH